MFKTLGSIKKESDTEKYEKDANAKTKANQLSVKAAEWISTDRDF